MHNYSGVPAVAGSLCFTITLVLAWCLVGIRSSSLVKKLFLSVPNLLKAHIDYLLMTGLFMIFYLLFAHFRLSVSPVILLAMSVGPSPSRLSQAFDKTQPAHSVSLWPAVSRLRRLVTLAQPGPLRTPRSSHRDRKEPI